MINFTQFKFSHKHFSTPSTPRPPPTKNKSSDFFPKQNSLKNIKGPLCSDGNHGCIWYLLHWFLSMGCLYTAALRLCHQRLLGWLLALGPSVSMVRVPSRFVFFCGGEKRWGFSLELSNIPGYQIGEVCSDW